MLKRYVKSKITDLLHFRIYKIKLGVLKQHPPRKINFNKFTNYKKRFSKLENYPKISIVTPSYNQGYFIQDTIESVLSQDYPNLEYHIQDGGSSDNTLSILNSYSKECLAFNSEKDYGQADAINKGFSRLSGEIMAWLNSDDLLLPGTLHFIADFFQKNPHIDVVYGNRLLVDQDNHIIGRWVLPGHDSSVLNYCDYVPQETLFWRRSLWDKIGGKLDDSFQFAMDWDLLLRMQFSGANFKHIPRFMGIFRVHEKQKTSAQLNDLGAQEIQKILQRVHNYIPDYQEVRLTLDPFMKRHIYADFLNSLRMLKLQFKTHPSS